MGSITTLVVLKHDKSADNLQDLILKVSGDSFTDIQRTIDKFVSEYNSAQTRSANPTVFDWFIANRQDLAEMDSQVYSYEALLTNDDDDDE